MKLSYWDQEIQDHFCIKLGHTIRFRMQKVLERFEFRFTGCTFVYDYDEILQMSQNVTRESSIDKSVRKLKNLTRDLIEDCPSSSQGQVFTHCTFVSVRDKEYLELQIGQLKKVNLRFIDCTFELRPLSLWEKLWDMLLRNFGEVFAYSKYDGGLIEVNDRTMRFRYLLPMLLRISERVAKYEET